MTRKVFCTLAFALVFAAACATTDTAMRDENEPVATGATLGGTEPTVDPSEAPGTPTAEAAPTHDPLGPPSRIESEIGKQYPSSAAGGVGNTTGSGTNTNLNPPPPAEPSVSVTQTPVVTTVTEVPPPPPIEPAPAPVTTTITTTEVIEEPPIITTRRVMVKKH